MLLISSFYSKYITNTYHYSLARDLSQRTHLKQARSWYRLYYCLLPFSNFFIQPSSRSFPLSCRLPVLAAGAYVSFLNQFCSPIFHTLRARCFWPLATIYLSDTYNQHTFTHRKIWKIEPWQSLEWNDVFILFKSISRSIRSNFRSCVTTYPNKKNENTVVKKTNVDEVYLKFKCQKSQDMLSSLNQVKLG